MDRVRHQVPVLISLRWHSYPCVKSVIFAITRL